MDLLDRPPRAVLGGRLLKLTERLSAQHGSRGLGNAAHITGSWRLDMNEFIKNLIDYTLEHEDDVSRNWLLSVIAFISENSK